MDYISGWCNSPNRLDGITAIVTGSNNGIGKETALDFYKRGARVIMACRDVEKAEAARKDIIKLSKETDAVTGTLIVEKLDLSNLHSVREFAFKILETQPNIQLLINNAGVMMCPETKTVDGLELQMGTNHFGHALLTLMLLPRLIKSAPSRIVFVSSRLHIVYTMDFDDMHFQKHPYNSVQAYSRSKAANILFARALYIKLKEHNINDVTTYSLHPGVVQTGIARHCSDTLATGITWIFNNVLSWFMKSPKCGAQTTIYCAVDDKCANESGLYYSDCAVTASSKHCQDKDAAEKLWNKTIETLKLEKYDPFGDLDPTKEML